MAVTHTATLSNSLFLLITVFGTYFAGAAILMPANVTGLLLPLSHAAIAVFTGTFIFSMVLFLSVNPMVILSLLLITIVLCVVILRKNIYLSFQINKAEILVFILTILFIMLSSEDVDKQFVAHQVGTDCYASDSYFFNAVTSSIRKGTIYSAVYELNSPINYQLFGFFIPAFWADVLSISSHQALWGLALPFYKLLIIALCYELSFFYLKDKVTRSNYGFIILSVALPVLLAPLHPLYVLKGDIKKFIFFGLGYLVPAGSIPFPAAIVLLLFCMLLFAKINWTNKKITADKVLFIAFLSPMIVAKFPLFVSYLFFLGAIILKRVLFDKEKITNYLGYGAASMFLAFLIYKVCMDQASGGNNFLKYGFLAELFGGWYGRKPVGLLNNVIIWVLILFTYLLWMGIRLVGMFGLVKAKFQQLSEYALGAVVSLAGASFMAAFLRIQTLSYKGEVISDITFNSLGFVRSSFYIISLVAAIGLLYLLYSGMWKKKSVNILFITTVAWCGLSLTSLLRSMWPAPQCPHVAWYDENYGLLKTGKYNDGLIAINPAKSYYGIMLSSSDEGKYWSCVNKYGTSYNSTTKNEYRWILFDKLLNDPAEQVLVKMKNDGVRYIVSTPVDSAQLSKASALFPQHLHRVSGTTWMFVVE